MTDAQQLFEFARKQFNGIADDVERHFDLVAGQLREWMPADSPFARVPPPPRRLPPPTTYQLLQRWVTRHRALTAAIVAFTLTGCVGAAAVYATSRNSRRRRRARKSSSGARTDVVVVAGAVASPLAAALYLDLERRGFVVYVIVDSTDDEQYIRSQARLDLLPLRFERIEQTQMEEQVRRFQGLLAREHRAFDDADPHRLRFCGLVLVPDTKADPTRVEELRLHEWHEAISGKIEHTIATAQLFMPVLIEHSANLVLLTPVVVPALRPPLHAVESTVYGALDGYVAAVAAEMRYQGVGVSHVKLGDIDIPAVTARQKRDGTQVSRLKATPLRRLNEAVFDALVATRPRRTWHVGRGSLAYDLIGRWAPAGVVTWMMGARSWAASEQEAEEAELHGSAGSLTWEKIDEDASGFA